MPAEEPGAALPGRRRVLWTRPAGRGASAVAALRRAGFEVDERPTIAFAPPVDEGRATRAATGISSYDWVVLTSATGVARLVAAMAASGAGVRPRRVAVVGRATRHAAERAGLAVELVADPPRAAGLARVLAPRLGRGERVLVVRPEIASDALPRALAMAGAGVDAVPFYRTVAARGARDVARDVTAGRYDAAVFASPSSFERMLEAEADREALRDALRTVAVVAIGPETARAMADRGVPVAAVAAEPSADALVHAVRSCFA
jgi:uroporphyrinogen-III synthase